MNLMLQRMFRHFFKSSADHSAVGGNSRDKLTLVQIQQALHAAVCDCTDIRAQRVNYKIDQAKTPADLWALRSDLHQCIAQVHSERVAASRINDLAGLFEGWLPASQLTRIQPGFRTFEK